jgi:2-phosphosulfolactate phosphatase
VSRILRSHTQPGHRVRLEWGPTGAAAVTRDADVAVVVDVLSFSTTVTVALGRGITVHPFRWRDERAVELARELDANLALQRRDARLRPGSVSLSPQSLQRATGIERLVLPSPNGSTICATLADHGATVVAGCLRNAGAVAAYVVDELARGATVAVVPAGERWPDGSLRPAVEDLWGAGAVIDRVDPSLLSPEAEVARLAYEGFRDRPLEHLLSCASGRELVDRGYEPDVVIAGRPNTTDVVPRLQDGAFAPA